ncbi:MAG: Abi family protein [Clostridia bacterium]|nr:Abi family protein [Clostridia bacterium]
MAKRYEKERVKIEQPRGKKIYIDYDRQIEKLRADGLEIPNEKAAKARLKWEGYYNFAVGYNRLFKDENRRYIHGVRFEHIEALYDFDRLLRDVVYEATQVVECNLKALISDKFSKYYGVDERSYLKVENFSSDPADKHAVHWLISTIKETLKDGVKKANSGYRDYIEYYAKTYGHVPLWALIRAISFGNTGKFLKLMKDSDAAEVALEYSISPSVLYEVVDIAIGFRNIAAHGERVYCAKIAGCLDPELSVYEKLGLARKENGELICGKCDFLAFLIAAKYLLSQVDFERFHSRVVAETERLEKALPAFAFERVLNETGLKGNWKKLAQIPVDRSKDRRVGL